MAQLKMKLGIVSSIKPTRRKVNAIGRMMERCEVEELVNWEAGGPCRPV